MQFLGMFRHARTSHAQGLTKEMFVSLGQSAVSARDVYAQGGLIVMAEGEMRNKSYLTRALKLSCDASMSLITARAYRMWGADYPRHIEGAVVTAVIDRTEDRMILSADRAGAIGVYYAWRGRAAAFASHPGLLLKMGAAGRGIERDGICELFALGGFFTPGKTAFRDIRLLEGGCVLIADSRGMRVKRYYSIVQEALKKDVSVFGAADYVSSLSRREYALFLSDGISMEIAEEIMGKGGAVFYHAGDSDEADEKADAFSKRLNAPVECVNVSKEAFCEMLKDAVAYTGFPGTGISDAVLLSLMKEAFCLFPAGIAGGKGAFCSESLHQGNLVRFLRQETIEKIDAEGYLRDRFNDLTDRYRIPLGEENGDQWAERLLCTVMNTAQLALRLRLLAEAAGGEIQTPLADERYMACMLNALSKTENTHSPGRNCRGECVSAIYEEMLALADSDDQPIFQAVDPRKIRSEVQGQCADVDALCRLLQINSFLYQFDAELSGV